MLGKPSLFTSPCLWWYASPHLVANEVKSTGARMATLPQRAEPHTPCLVPERSKFQLGDVMNRLRSTLLSVLFLTLVFLSTPPAFSQTFTTEDVVGVVADTSGAMVPGATVTIRSAESGEVRTVVSSDQGQYR